MERKCFGSKRVEWNAHKMYLNSPKLTNDYETLDLMVQWYNNRDISANIHKIHTKYEKNYNKKEHKKHITWS